MLRPIIAIAAAALVALAFTSTEASARFGGFRGGGFHGGFRGGFRGFGPGIGLGLGLGYGLGNPYYHGGYPYYGYGYGGCVRPTRVWTAYGWRIVPVNVCGYY
jgi:hypothetical protein